VILAIVFLICAILVVLFFRHTSHYTESVGFVNKTRNCEQNSGEKKTKKKRKPAKKNPTGEPQKFQFEKSKQMSEEDAEVRLLHARGVGQQATKATSSMLPSTGLKRQTAHSPGK